MKASLTADRATLTGLALAMCTLLVVSLTPPTVSRAAWVQDQWAHSPLSVAECQTPESYATQASGTLIGGSVLGVDLDGIAQAQGVDVTNDGQAPSATPASALSLGDGAYANPLHATILSAISANLTGVLTFPADTEVGAVNQYARATGHGPSAGASGVVNDSGAIDLGSASHHSELPDIATLHLGTLLSAGAGQNVSSLVTNLADARLSVGAVGASATLDACAAQWEDLYTSLTRDYLIAGLSTQLESPLVGDLTGTVDTTLVSLETAIAALASDEGLLDTLTDDILGSLGDILGLLQLGTPVAELELGIDLSATRALLTGVITDSQNVVAIDLGTGIINVDIAALVDEEDGLNGLPPNEQLLLNDQAINALTERVEDALADWTGTVLTSINSALDAVTVSLSVNYAVLGAASLTLDVQVDGSVTDLGDGNGTVSIGRTGSCNPVEQLVACGPLDLLLELVDLAARKAVSQAVGGIVSNALDLTSAPLVSSLTGTLTSVTSQLVTMLSQSLELLFGEDALLSVVINAQNAPDPAENVGSPVPGWAASMPGQSWGPYSTGQYGVSAIRIVGLGVLGASGLLELDLGHATAGSNSSL